MNYDVIIIGSGLGGMLTGAILAKKGKKVLVLEQYKRIGGRFSSYDIDGYKVPTGAFHTVPYGKYGAFAEISKELRIDRVKDFQGYGHYYYKGKVYPISRRKDLAKIFNIFEYWTLGQILFQSTEKLDSKMTMEQYLKKKHVSKKTFSFFNNFCAFAIGLYLNQISAVEFIRVIQRLRYCKNPGYVEGGCGAYIEDLKNIILSNGGEIKTEEKVTEFIFENNEIIGVKGNEDYFGEKFIYNGSPNALAQFKGNIIDLKEPLEPACGVAIHFGSEEPITEEKGIILCIGTDFIPGLVCQSMYDPTVSPKGEYLLSTCFESKGNLNKDVENVKNELAKMFGKEKVDKLKILRKCSYQKNWPANYAVQGTDLDGTTNYDNLFMVGDGCKPSSNIMIEGVSESVKRVLEFMGDFTFRRRDI